MRGFNGTIGGKGLSLSTVKAAALLGGVIMITASIVAVAYAGSVDVPQALNLITLTADRICNVVSMNGEAESSDAKGEVKAQLSGLAAKLADMGISGSISITRDKYQNVLRHDLASTLHDNASCKLKVFSTLQAKLLSFPTPQQHSRPEMQKNHASVYQSSTGDNSPNISNSHDVRIGE